MRPKGIKTHFSCAAMALKGSEHEHSRTLQLEKGQSVNILGCYGLERGRV